MKIYSFGIGRSRVVRGGVAALVLSAAALAGVAPAEAAVAKGTFTLTASPKSLSIKPGGIKTLRLVVKRGKGFKAPLTFQVENPMAGVVATTGKVSSAGTRLTVRTDTTVPPQSGQIVVTATGGGKSQRATISVMTAGGTAAVAAAPAPTPAPAPAPAPAAPTTQALPSTPFQLSAQSLLGKASPGSQLKVNVTVIVPSTVTTKPEVKIKLTGLPPGATSSPTELTTNSFGSFVVTFAKDTAPGDYRITAEGTSGNATGKGVTDPIEIRTTPLLRFASGESGTLRMAQGETKSMKIFSWGIAGISPVKLSTTTVIPNTTISFSPTDTDGVATMTVASTQTSPVVTTNIEIVGTGSTGTTSSLKTGLIIDSNGRSTDFTLSSGFDEDPKNADGFLQILPGHTTTFRVNVKGGSAGAAPPVTIRFPSNAGYTVSPESITTDSTAAFQITFNQANEAGVTVQAVGSAGSVVQTTAIKIRVSGKPRIKGQCSGIQFFKTPGLQSKKYSILFSRVIGMPPPEILLTRSSRPEIINWAWTGTSLDGFTFEITITAYANQIDAGRWTLGSIFAKNATRDPVGISDPLQFMYLISNVGDADSATCSGYR
jgi:hypothetical protein